MNSLAESRLFVIVLDDAMIPADPTSKKNAKDIARKVVDQLGPTDLAAVILTGDNRGAQNFTNDHARLLAALDKFSPGLANYSFNRQSPDDYFWESTISALRNVTDYLIAVPMRRKALIWISPGVPVDFNAKAPVLAQPVTGLSDSSMGERETMANLIADTDEFYREAQRANVAVYSIDPTGVGGLENYIMLQLKGPDAMRIAHEKATLSLDFSIGAATNTGGLAVANTNDFDTGIAQIFRENSSYYLLGFKSGSTKTDGSLQRLQIKVNRPEAEAHARNGYYAPDSGKIAEAEQSAAASPLTAAISGLLPNPDMPMQVMSAAFARPATKTTPAGATVAVAMGVRQFAPEDAAKMRVTETVDLMTSAFTPEGTSRGSSTRSAMITLKQGATGEFAYEVVSTIDLQPGRYELRLALHSGSLGKSGSVFLDVDVPDFVNAPLSLSGVVLNAAPAVPFGPKEGLTPFLPIVPTTRRDFERSDVVSAFLRVYQGGKKGLVPVTLRTNVLDDHDGAVFTNEKAIAAEAFDQELRATDFQIELPIATLKPGKYVATFKGMAAGKTLIERDIRFTIR